MNVPAVSGSGFPENSTCVQRSKAFSIGRKHSNAKYNSRISSHPALSLRDWHRGLPLSPILRSLSWTELGAGAKKQAHHSKSTRSRELQAGAGRDRILDATHPG
ncbi:hypothetical protein Y1Q_0013099 [Alligator mississippiensis]|uniref:Uncharacterized protein n=1 Tax=Alligator mississippiensis TaxID=8496 RepID=A0A151NGV8_ALLMI|nr:hypothetical protein Y1Q_0013099 [Alligator mississippiensis]